MGNDKDWGKILEWLEPEPPKYSPHTPTAKQKLFLRYEGLECLFGGAGGGGKSDALLMAALQWTHVPGYSAILFRNSFADLTLPNAIMDRSHRWLDEVSDVQWIQSKHTWLFPSGATLSFGYLDKPLDHLKYKSMEVCFVGMDEVTEIREEHYRYLFSRLRKPAGNLALSKVPLRMRCASNPAPNWVRRRFIEDTSGKRLFIPSRLSDNPHINQEAYLRSLEEVSPIERARMEQGDWYAEDEGALFQQKWFKIINKDDLPDNAYNRRVRYWDLASTEPTGPDGSNPDPDYTAGALVSILDGNIIIHDMCRFRHGAAGVEQRIKEQASIDGTSVQIRMEQEGGATGKIVIDHYARHVLLGYDFDGWPTKKNKETRANLWVPSARNGRVLLVDGPWVTPFLEEAVAFGAVHGVHDDQIDAVSGAFEFLSGLGGPRQNHIQIII